MSVSNAQWEFLQDVAKLIEYAKVLGLKLTGGHLWRSDAQQLLFYYGKDIVAKNGELEFVKAPKRSWTLNSDHKRKLAIDFNFFDDGKYLSKPQENSKVIKLARFWEGLNSKNYWGGFWKTPDAPHFGRKL